MASEEDVHNMDKGPGVLRDSVSRLVVWHWMALQRRVVSRDGLGDKGRLACNDTPFLQRRRVACERVQG